MRGVINTLVLATEHRAGGPPGNQAACCTYSAAFTQSNSGSVEMGQHVPSTSCSDCEQVALSQRWAA